MGMTYYAVTNDPNELAHFGIKGMKWGVRKEKPRSAAYKKAQSKLGKMMKSGIKKAEAHWQMRNSPEVKQYKAFKKYEKQTNKAIEQARKGKLKYGKLTDDQVQRVTERLAMEREARMLSESEKTWGKRLRQSIGEGIISGVGSGVGRITSEAISRRSTLKTDRKRKELMNQMDIEQRRRTNAMDLEQQRRLELQKQQLDSFNERRKVHEKARNEADAEYYKEAAERGYNPYTSALRAGRLPSIQTRAERQRQLGAWKAENAESERRKRQQELTDKSYYETMGRLGAIHNTNLYTGSNNKQPSTSSIIPTSASVTPGKKYKLKRRPGR